MTKTYGVVLIGCGHIGEDHISQIYYRENIRIVAVVDEDAERAQLFARKYGAAMWETDYRSCITRDDVDIVIIATYVNTHLDILRDCLAAGKHVLCEKPIAANLADGEEFCRLAMQAKTHVLVAHILRYNESYRRIRALIQSGVIGDVKVIRMTQNHHALNWPRYKRLLADCSPVLDCGVHYYDIIQWFTGARITRVQGIGTVIDNDLAADQVNYGLVSMQLSNGAIAYYEAGWSQNCSSSNVKEFIGDKGRITLTMKNFRCTHVEEGDCIEVYHNDTDCYETMNVQANYKNMWEQLKALIDLIEGRETDAPTIADIHSAFLVGMAADAAIRNNTAVTVGR